MTWACRCTREKCKQRRTLRKHPATYMREPVCLACGSRLRIDWTRQSGDEARKGKHNEVCRCDGYSFPHRRASPNCIHRKLSKAQQQDLERAAEVVADMDFEIPD